MDRQRLSGKLSFIIVFTIFAFIIASCTSPAATEPAILPVTGNQPTIIVATPLLDVATDDSSRNSVLAFMDGSIFILRPGTIIKELPSLNDNSNKNEVQFELTKGEVLILPNIESGKWISIQNSDGNGTRVKGCGMDVSIDPITNDFDMTCIGGSCELGLDVKNMFSVNANESWSVQKGELHGPEPINQMQLETLYSDQIPSCPLYIPVTGGEVTPTLPPTINANIGATATSACKNFKSKFPGTPCP
jgi:hypothetical protein